MEEIRINRLNRLINKNINKLHGWLVIGEESKNYYNQIYSCYNEKKYVEVSIVTKDYINPFPYDINVQYQGIVNEYLGNMPIKNN